MTLKWEISCKNVLSKSIQAKLSAAFQKVKEIKKALAKTEDKWQIISKQLVSAALKLNATEPTFSLEKDISASISSFETNCCNCLGNIQTSGMMTYNGTRTLETVIFFVFILYRHVGTYAKDLGLTDIIAIPLTNCWAAVALLQFCIIPVV